MLALALEQFIYQHHATLHLIWITNSIVCLVNCYMYKLCFQNYSVHTIQKHAAWSATIYVTYTPSQLLVQASKGL